ncbi:toxin-antitoxin system YwqK family antitoxin [Arhodomonas aquaeolei]|uniref:toxin-antitoxin system YwqK family antitoxin n=1 Tax=Arhodomonas aquaeolei TaxID=2369 RepID=UPI00035D87FE|nr:hypothetical protein [Arhodomonas aquaeolei]
MTYPRFRFRLLGPLAVVALCHGGVAVAAQRPAAEGAANANPAAAPTAGTGAVHDAAAPRSRIRTVGTGSDRREIHEEIDGYGYVNARHTVFPGLAREIDVRFAPNGRVSHRRERRDGHRVGLFIETVSPGHYVRRHYDAQGRRHGTETEVIDGRTVTSVTYVHGSPVGPFHRTDTEGRRTEGHYVDGELDGAYRITRDGRTVERSHYDHGVKDGPHVRYDSEGNILEKGRYVDGDREGPWIEPARLGDHWRGDYRHGKRRGRWRIVDARGYPVEEGVYDDAGRRTGLWAVYRDNGELRDCPLYRDDERVEHPDYDYDSGQTAIEYCNGQLEAAPER